MKSQELRQFAQRWLMKSTSWSLDACFAPLGLLHCAFYVCNAQSTATSGFNGAKF
jgi:hypothetical protein